MKKISRNEFTKQLQSHTGKQQSYVSIQLKDRNKTSVELIADIESKRYKPDYQSRQIDSIETRSKDIIINKLSHLYLETGSQYYLLDDGSIATFNDKVATYGKYYIMLYILN